MLLVLLAFTALAQAQDGGVTDNDVIRVAERMYCPVCENIPLDDCETTACVEWKAEIRAQLAEGRSDEAVIDSFVARFGDNVVGVPQDPVLRALGRADAATGDSAGGRRGRRHFSALRRSAKTAVAPNPAVPQRSRGRRRSWWR